MVQAPPKISSIAVLCSKSEPSAGQEAVQGKNKLGFRNPPQKNPKHATRMRMLPDQPLLEVPYEPHPAPAAAAADTPTTTTTTTATNAAIASAIGDTS